MKHRKIILFVLLIFPVFFVSAESAEKSGIRLIENNGTFTAELTVGDYAPDGVKYVWSRHPDPVYPTRNTDKYIYQPVEDIHPVTLDAFDGAGEYYVRAGWYVGGKVLFYSETLKVKLGGNTENSQKVSGAYKSSRKSIQVKVNNQQTAQVLLTYTDSKPDGVKILWSKNPYPVYPVRDKDMYLYCPVDSELQGWLEPFDGPGKYYVRAGWYVDGRVIFYSPQITVNLE